MQKITDGLHCFGVFIGALIGVIIVGVIRICVYRIWPEISPHASPVFIFFLPMLALLFGAYAAFMELIADRLGARRMRMWFAFVIGASYAPLMLWLIHPYATSLFILVNPFVVRWWWFEYKVK